MGLPGMAVVKVNWEAESDYDLTCQMQAEWVAVYRVASLMRGWPRRLGTDADGGQLATDKKMHNKVRHLAELQFVHWFRAGHKNAKLDDWTELASGEIMEEERTAAATQDWLPWTAAQLGQTVDDYIQHKEWRKQTRGALPHEHIWKHAIRTLAGLNLFLIERTGFSPAYVEQVSALDAAVRYAAQTWPTAVDDIVSQLPSASK